MNLRTNILILIVTAVTMTGCGLNRHASGSNNKKQNDNALHALEKDEQRIQNEILRMEQESQTYESRILQLYEELEQKKQQRIQEESRLARLPQPHAQMSPEVITNRIPLPHYPIWAGGGEPTLEEYTFPTAPTRITQANAESDIMVVFNPQQLTQEERTANTFTHQTENTSTQTQKAASAWDSLGEGLFDTVTTIQTTPTQPIVHTSQAKPLLDSAAQQRQQSQLPFEKIDGETKVKIAYDKVVILEIGNQNGAELGDLYKVETTEGNIITVMIELPTPNNSRAVFVEGEGTVVPGARAIPIKK